MDGGGVGDGLAGGVGGEQGGGGEPVDRAGVAAAGLVDQAGGVVGEQGVGAAGELGVMPQVGPGFVGGHRGHCVPDADPLVQGGEHAEPHAGPQLGLAEEQYGQRAGGVELGAGQHADRLELVVGEQVGLVDFSDRSDY